MTKILNYHFCFEYFNKELAKFLLRWTILSKDIQRKHKLKDGDIVFYFDDHFSNIHNFNLKEHRDLTEEVLSNTKNYNEGKEWDLLTGVYIWLPKKKWVLDLIDKNIKGGETNVS